MSGTGAAANEHGATHPWALRLADVPPELISRVLLHLHHARDLAAANATARLFRGVPGERSPVEHALRARVLARGHDCALPPSLPADVRSWTEELFDREHVLELARAHRSAVAVGMGHSCHSAFVDAEGWLHTCGEGFDELDEHGEVPDEPRAHVAMGHGVVRALRVPARVASLSAVRVVAVAAGGEYVLALSDCGAVYACGDNQCGKLGLGDMKRRHSFTRVDAMQGMPVVGVSAGGFHSLALTAAGCAYSWGDNCYGQLGHGDTKWRWEPTRIEALDRVRVGGVATGVAHTLLLSTAGAVYSCGDACTLGHADKQFEHTPKRIEALVGVRAVHVSAGYSHNLVVDAEGGVHSFGRGTDGQLGHGGRHAHARVIDLSAEWHTQLTPKRIEALADVHAVRASCCWACSAVLGADGSVHTFGSNKNGQLGSAAHTEWSIPWRVAGLADARVLDCAIGDSHGLFVTADGATYACGRQSAGLGIGLTVNDAVLTQPPPLEIGGWTIPMSPEALPAPLQRVTQLPPLAGTLH